jgi:aspartate kinase
LHPYPGVEKRAQTKSPFPFQAIPRNTGSNVLLSLWIIKMPRLVMKFGGTSVADLDKIANAADKVRQEVETGFEVVVIVSAMSGKTNELVRWVKDCTSKSGDFDKAEYDAVVSSGENVTSGLMALQLQAKGISTRSWQGWQIPIHCTGQHGAARIDAIPTKNLDASFATGVKVAVVAGFQGLMADGRIATLGRGGSDTTAVAFAAALGAERCDIYTDVDGIYTTDPRIVSNARKLHKISYEEMLELASLGAKVLQTRSVELARSYRVRLRVLSSFEDDITANAGTIVCSEEEIMENIRVVKGVAYSRDEAKMTLVSVADRPGVAAAIFGPLADAGVNVDMIVQNISEDGRTDMTFSCPVDHVPMAETAMRKAANDGELNYRNLITDTNVAKISIVGNGMRSQAGVAKKMFKILATHNANIQVITTSEIKISVLVDRKYMELVVRALHDEFELQDA